MTLVTATIAPERLDEVVKPYQDAVDGELPSGMTDTLLLLGDHGTVVIASVWRTHDDLDAMRASGDEPLARRLLREAGGQPILTVYEVAAAGGRHREA